MNSLMALPAVMGLIGLCSIAIGLFGLWLVISPRARLKAAQKRGKTTGELFWTGLIGFLFFGIGGMGILGAGPSEIGDDTRWSERPYSMVDATSYARSLSEHGYVERPGWHSRSWVWENKGEVTDETVITTSGESTPIPSDFQKVTVIYQKSYYNERISRWMDESVEIKFPKSWTVGAYEKVLRPALLPFCDSEEACFQLMSDNSLFEAADTRGDVMSFDHGDKTFLLSKTSDEAMYWVLNIVKDE